MATTIRTKDMEEAAFLWTDEDRFGLVNIETTRGYGNRTVVWFCFSTQLPEDTVTQLRNDYRMGKCLVEPRKYSSRRLQVKNIVRDKCHPDDDFPEK